MKTKSNQSNWYKALAFCTIILMTGVISAQEASMKVSIKEKNEESKEVVDSSVLKGTESVSELDCGCWDLFAVGSNKPETKVDGFEFNKIKRSEIPFPYRLQAEFVADGDNKKLDVFKSRIPAGICGEDFTLYGTDKVKYMLAVSQGANCIDQSCEADCESRSDCLAGCSPCDAYAKYRIVYDLKTHELCAQKRVKGNRGTWIQVNNRILRPGVHRMIDVKFKNYNALRDTIGLVYSFEDLNMDDQSAFTAALLEVESETEEGEESGSQGSEEEDKEDDAELADDGADDDDSKGIVAVKEELVQKSSAASTYADRMDVFNAIGGITTFGSMDKFNDIMSMDKMDDPMTGFLDPLSNSMNQVFTIQQDFSPSDFSQLDIYELFKESGILDSLSNDPMIPVLNEDELKEQSEQLKENVETAKEKEAIEELKKFGEGLQGVYESNAALAITPERSKVKKEIVALLNKYSILKEFLDLNSSKTVKEQLSKLLKDAKTKEVIDEEKKKKLDETVNDIQDLYKKLTKYQVQVLAPIQMQDYDRLNMHFKLQDEKLNATPYRFYSKGGWKIDFSTGVVVSGLRDDIYTWSNVSDTTLTSVTETIVEGDSTTVSTTETASKSGQLVNSGPNGLSDIDWGLGVYAHFYPRLGTTFNASFTLGVLGKKDGLDLMAGSSLLFGRKHRLALSGGAILGNAARLKREYSGLDLNTASIVNADAANGSIADVTESRRDISWFVGISYNITGNSSKK